MLCQPTFIYSNSPIENLKKGEICLKLTMKAQEECQ